MKYPNIRSTDGLYGFINAIFICKKIKKFLKRNLWLSVIQRDNRVNLFPDNLSLSKPEKKLVNWRKNWTSSKYITAGTRPYVHK